MSRWMTLLGALQEIYDRPGNAIEGPKQHLIFLGIVLDTNTMTLELPQQRITELVELLTSILHKTKITKRQLMSVAGKLNWATQVIYGGRFHLRRILDIINGLRLPWHHTRVTKEMRKDIIWWISFMSIFNGSTLMLDDRPTTSVCIDACTVAAGAFCDYEYVYTPWAQWPAAQNYHINYKEALALEPAVKQWAYKWSNKTVYVHSDNQTAVNIINKGSCKDQLVMQSLRNIFWYSAIYNFRIKAVYIPGIYNQIADCISRLHENNSLERLRVLVNSMYKSFDFIHSCFPGSFGEIT